MAESKPLGFDAAAADWNEAYAGRPMNLADWNSMTLGEQARYGATECQTKGAIYKSRVNESEIHFTVQLPSSMKLTGLTEREAKWIEAALHRKLEETIVWIIRGREIEAAG